MRTEDSALDSNAMEQEAPPNVEAGTAVAVILGLVGCIAGAYVGYFLNDGFVTIMASILGGVFLFTIVWCVGPPGRYYLSKFVAMSKPADLSRVKTTGFASWDLYVTVHHCNNVYSTEGVFGWMLGVGTQNFVELKMGRALADENFLITNNPVKRTCISTKNIYEECFHLNVTPTDDTLRIILYDQDVFGNTAVGTVDIDVDMQIMKAGFPQKKSFRMERELSSMFKAGQEEGDTDFDARTCAGSVILSFAPGHDYPKFAQASMGVQRPLATRNLLNANSSLAKDTMAGGGQYATWLLSQTSDYQTLSKFPRPTYGATAKGMRGENAV